MGFHNNEDNVDDIMDAVRGIVCKIIDNDVINDTISIILDDEPPVYGLGIEEFSEIVEDNVFKAISNAALLDGIPDRVRDMLEGLDELRASTSQGFDTE